METELKNQLYGYLLGSSFLFIYIFLASGFFGNIEETNYQYPFHIDFRDFRFYGFPVIFGSGAIMFIPYFLLLKLSPKLKYIYILGMILIGSFAFSSLFFQSPLFSLPFYLLFIGGIIFYLPGLIIKNEKVVFVAVTGAILAWSGLTFLPPIL